MTAPFCVPLRLTGNVRLGQRDSMGGVMSLHETSFATSPGMHTGEQPGESRYNSSQMSLIDTGCGSTGDHGHVHLKRAS
jgi:hypothetical protein